MCIQIPFRSYTFNLKADHTGDISSFLGATIRGGFGYTLKSLVCSMKNKPCKACSIKHKCIYCYLFETVPEKDSLRLKKYHHIPHPFIFYPRQNRDAITMEVTLFGDSSQYLPYFIYTFNTLGERGLGKNRTTFSVETVTNEKGVAVYSGEKNLSVTDTHTNNISIEPAPPKQAMVQIKFQSPLVLRRNGKILQAFDTYAFFSTLLRRVTNLNAFYGTQREIQIDPFAYLCAVEGMKCDAFIERICKKRFSTRQKRHIDYSGIIGVVTLIGNIGTLMPLLRAGEIIHVGKNTAFGYGKYRIETGDC